MLIRLQKYMAEKGIASRRKSEELIMRGVVKVNGNVITEAGTKIDDECDIVEVEGKAIDTEKTEMHYYMLNKPAGYVSTAKDQFKRPSVIDIVKCDTRLYPIGRLDYETEGLILLTNDGDLTYKLTHPKHSIAKVYEARITGRIMGSDIEEFKKGIDIGNYVTRPAELQILKAGEDFTYVRITIKEGKNRQVRRMCEAIGHKVMKLRRVAIGNISMGSLRVGEYRELNAKELNYLKNL